MHTQVYGPGQNEQTQAKIHCSLRSCCLEQGVYEAQGQAPVLLFVAYDLASANLPIRSSQEQRPQVIRRCQCVEPHGPVHLRKDEPSLPQR